MGQSVGFAPGRLVLCSKQVAAIQFPVAGLRPNSHVMSARMGLEMLGETELFGNADHWQHDSLGVQVQIVLSSASIPLTSSDFDISMA